MRSWSASELSVEGAMRLLPRLCRASRSWALQLAEPARVFSTSPRP